MKSNSTAKGFGAGKTVWAGSISGLSSPATKVEYSPCPTVEKVTQKPRLDHCDGVMLGFRAATPVTPGKAAG